MIDYTELVKALRVEPFEVESEGLSKVMNSAADAIEALQAEKKKTVTQIFGEEQQEWEEYCTGLMNRIMELKAQLPKRGEWKPFDLTWGRSIYSCTVCGEAADVPTANGEALYKYCPNCGADMRKKEVQ